MKPFELLPSIIKGSIRQTSSFTEMVLEVHKEKTYFKMKSLSLKVRSTYFITRQQSNQKLQWLLWTRGSRSVSFCWMLEEKFKMCLVDVLSIKISSNRKLKIVRSSTFSWHLRVQLRVVFCQHTFLLLRMTRRWPNLS